MFGFFFFKQKTAYEFVSRDWSSDVCSSDLVGVPSPHAVSAGLDGTDSMVTTKEGTYAA